LFGCTIGRIKGEEVSRPEAIRRLVDLSLEAAKKGKGGR
jgi:hypothetical protein